jgi:hypothetical protein
MSLYQKLHGLWRYPAPEKCRESLRPFESSRIRKQLHPVAAGWEINMHKVPSPSRFARAGLPDEDLRAGNLTRREFLMTSLSTTLAASVSGDTIWAKDTGGEIPYRTLGRTGEKVSIVGLGGYHIGIQSDEKQSIAIIRTALDKGINFLDNCWDYNDGLSELRMGKALRDGYRSKGLPHDQD